MRCIVCDATDKWKNVDEYRLAPKGMSICESCGFVSYPDKWKSPEEIKAYYKKEYRNAPNAGNYFTGERKIHYHAAFLDPILKGWKQIGKKPVISEIGAAYGLFLHWLEKNIPGAEIHGVELTKTYRRNAWHEFKIKLDEDFDDSRKYDLICSYKVLEHQMDADKELRRYAEALSEDGLLYISVPQWFGQMNNFGMPGFDVEYYYSTNHINTWTRKLFETVLKKAGLEVVRENHVYYDSTYLCKRNDDMMKVLPEHEKPEEIVEKMKKIKDAALMFQEGKYNEALNIWPNFPDAWTHLYESKRAMLDKAGFENIKKDFMSRMLLHCPDTASIFSLCADICMRYSRWNEAMDYLQQALVCRPEFANALIQLSHCYRQMGYAETESGRRAELFKNAREASRHLRGVSAQHFKDSMDWIYQDNANIPTPFELESNSAG